MLTNLLFENFRLNTDQIFEGLTPEELETLNRSGVTHLYKKGEIIFREGGIPTGIFYVKRWNTDGNILCKERPGKEV
jgi:hypothetical protein